MITAKQIKQAGYDARMEGCQEWQSPFQRGERGSLEWLDGWNEADSEIAAHEEAEHDRCC